MARLIKTWPKIVVHADMDAFYAAVEQLDNPSLQGKPVLIGPNSNRGVVLTASYEARPFGVGSAMPVAKARRLCPDAIMVSPRFERYQQVSAQIMDVFADFSPRVEALSLDEAFLDMSGAEHFFGDPRQMGERIKQAILDATKLNISVGVSGTKYVAKVASAHDKPNGLTIVPPEQAKDWLAPLPVTRLWGVGIKTAPRLHALGLHTVGDIAAQSPQWMRQKLGRGGAHFYQLAHAQDPRSVERGRSSKSIGSDRTLSTNVARREDIELHLRRSAQRIARRLRTKQYVAHGVRVRLKTAKFQMLSRQMKLPTGTDTASQLMTAARALLDQYEHQLHHLGPFRLVGMAAFDLDWASQGQQLDLFSQPKQRDLEVTLDRVLDKFGGTGVIRAKDMAKHLTNQSTVSKNGVNLDFLDHRDGEHVARPERS